MPTRIFFSHLLQTLPPNLKIHFASRFIQCPLGGATALIWSYHHLMCTLPTMLSFILYFFFIHSHLKKKEIPADLNNYFNMMQCFFSSRNSFILHLYILTSQLQINLHFYCTIMIVLGEMVHITHFSVFCHISKCS